MPSEAAGYACLCYGLLILYLAWFFPKALRFLPGNRWLHLHRYPGTPVAVVLIASALVLCGLAWAVIVPYGWQPWAFGGGAALVLAALVHDVGHYRRHGPAPDPLAEAPPSSSGRRR